MFFLSVYQLFMISFQGFGGSKEHKFLWQCAIYAIFWCIWLSVTLKYLRRFLWNNSSYGIQFVIWSKELGHFKGIFPNRCWGDLAALNHCCFGFYCLLKRISYTPNPLSYVLFILIYIFFIKKNTP